MPADEDTLCCWYALVWSEARELFWLLVHTHNCTARQQHTVISSRVWGGLLCLQLYHSWHKSALRAWFLWSSLALCYGGHHAMSKMQSKRLLGTAWAGLGCGLCCVNWLWRGTAAPSVNHHPLPTAGTTWHLKHQETLYKKQASRPIKTCHLYCSCVLIVQH